MKSNILLTSLLCLSVGVANSSEVSSFSELARVEVAYRTQESIDAISAAAPFLKCELFTITTKEAVPPSGDKHDYVSIGSYYWPNPNTEDGYPWVYRDGEFNRASITLYSDVTTFRNMTSAVVALARAYEMTKDDKYAERVQEVITTFFIDKTTKMNPHLTYAKITPQGPNLETEGECFGIIETASLQEMLEGVTLVSVSPKWRSKTTEGLSSWVKDFKLWLEISKQGKAEGAIKKNNHGTHYDAQYLSLLSYLGLRSEMAEYIQRVCMPRLDHQVKADGSQPLELARTKSWNYCRMNLRGWLHIADFATEAGVDLWGYKRGDQIFIKSMINWYLPYLKAEKEWSWKQIIRGKLFDVQEILVRGAEIYNEPSYLELSRNLKPLKDGVIR